MYNQISAVIVLFINLHFVSECPFLNSFARDGLICLFIHFPPFTLIQSQKRQWLEPVPADFRQEVRGTPWSIPNEGMLTFNRTTHLVQVNDFVLSEEGKHGGVNISTKNRDWIPQKGSFVFCSHSSNIWLEE